MNYVYKQSKFFAKVFELHSFFCKIIFNSPSLNKKVKVLYLKHGATEFIRCLLEMYFCENHSIMLTILKGLVKGQAKLKLKCQNLPVIINKQIEKQA